MRRDNHENPGGPRAGQALVEMVAGLVAILVVFAGLVQIGRLGRAHTQAMMDARAEAGTFAASDQYVMQSPAPQYLYNWSEGGDDRRHSRDDRPLFALANAVRDDIMAHGRPEDLATRIGENILSEAYANEAVMDSFQLVHGREESDEIELFPVVRELLYDQPSLRMEGDVWLGWTRGL